MALFTYPESLLAHVKDFIFLLKRIVGDSSKKSPDPRIVFIKKSQLDLGVHLCGGNLHGVFVAEVEDDSPAKGPDGLVPGDLILEVSSATVCQVMFMRYQPLSSYMTQKMGLYFTYSNLSRRVVHLVNEGYSPAVGSVVGR